MNCCRLFAFAFLSLAILTSVAPKDTQKLYVKATRCNRTEKYFYKNISCYAKSYSRTYSASFMYMLAKAPIKSDFKISITIYYKYGLVFRDVIRTPPIDICSLSYNLKHNQLALTLATRTIMSMINKAAPDLVHECPYNGLFVKNASWDMDSVPSMFASGEYKMLFVATVKDEFTGSVSVIVEVNSPIKDTFG